MLHFEHEVLQRSYHSDETMYGDPIAEIPPTHFWVSEDGYAWDMEELSEAIKSSGGIMCNPLSRQMFTPDDIHAIVAHPLGRGVAALQLEQGRLSQGVRSETVDRLQELADVLTGDDSDDQIPSREAVEKFLAYVATLPLSKQKAIDALRVPARDRHTGMPYDTTIGESVRDAQGNRFCFHKTGDFIGQAALYLRKRN